MPNPRIAYALMDAYARQYELRFGRKPGLNRYRDKWGFGDMIDDLGYDRAIEVVKFYLETGRDSYTPQALFNCYDRLDVSLQERDADREHRAEIRRKTEIRVREWESTHES